MSSKNSTTPPPSITMSESPDRTMFAGSPFTKGPGGGLDTVASTPPPPPPEDPLDYEKSVFKGRIAEGDLSFLKEQIRVSKGLPLTLDKEKLKPKINSIKSPKVKPHSTFTSRKRRQLQQHRILVRCANMREQYREFEKEHSDDGSTDEKFRDLRNEALSKTDEEVNHEFEQEELANLKALAVRAKKHEIRNFAETRGSTYRYKYNRGQPIISENFRNSYDDYQKLPFCLCPKLFEPKPHQLPSIDKQKETWMVPLEDDHGIPLHYQPKSPDPKDKRSKREKERPPVKKGKRTPMSEWKSVKSQATTKRPPWGSYFGCPSSVGLFK